MQGSTLRSRGSISLLYFGQNTAQYFWIYFRSERAYLEWSWNYNHIFKTHECATRKVFVCPSPVVPNFTYQTKSHRSFFKVPSRASRGQRFDEVIVHGLTWAIPLYVMAHFNRVLQKFTIMDLFVFMHSVCPSSYNIFSMTFDLLIPMQI